MTLQAEIAEIEKALRDAGASLDRVLAEARVDRSTWTRWKNGTVTGARYDTMSRVRAAAAAVLERSAPSDSHDGGAPA